jgi:hypothetical protein
VRVIRPPLVTNYLLNNENDIHIVIIYALITTVILKVVGNENGEASVWWQSWVKVSDCGDRGLFAV